MGSRIWWLRLHFPEVIQTLWLDIRWLHLALPHCVKLSQVTGPLFWRQWALKRRQMQRAHQPDVAFQTLCESLIWDVRRRWAPPAAGQTGLIQEATLESILEARHRVICPDSNVEVMGVASR